MLSLCTAYWVRLYFGSACFVPFNKKQKQTKNKTFKRFHLHIEDKKYSFCMCVCFIVLKWIPTVHVNVLNDKNLAIWLNMSLSCVSWWNLLLFKSKSDICARYNRSFAFCVQTFVYFERSTAPGILRRLSSVTHHGQAWSHRISTVKTAHAGCTCTYIRFTLLFSIAVIAYV